MPPKALVMTPLTVVTTLGISGNTNIRDTNLNLVIVGQLQEITD